MTFHRIPRNHGFSLPEVTIAVGIAALGLIALLGLMPQGLEMARKTGELAAHRQIVEQISRDLEQTSWANLQILVSNTSGQIRAFNDQGVEVLPGAIDTTYIANVRVFDLTAQLPQGTTGTPQTENFLRKVVTRIATTTNQNYAFDDPSTAGNFSTFNTYIARSF